MQDIKEKGEAVRALLAEGQTEILKELGNYLEAVLAEIEKVTAQKETVEEYVAVEKKMHHLFSVLFEQAKAKEPQLGVFQELAQTVDVFLGIEAAGGHRCMAQQNA